MYLKIVSSPHLPIIDYIKLCLDFKSHQFEELPTEVVTKISYRYMLVYRNLMYDYLTVPEFWWVQM